MRSSGRLARNCNFGDMRRTRSIPRDRGGSGAESPDDHRVDDAHGGDQDLAEYEGRGEGRHFAQAAGLIGDPSGVLFVESHEFIPGRDST